MRYENSLHEAKEAIAPITINRPPNNVLDIKTMRKINQAVQEATEHRRELKPLVPTHAGDKPCMERLKPVEKGA